jgi:hypothetical protein
MNNKRKMKKKKERGLGDSSCLGRTTESEMSCKFTEVMTLKILLLCGGNWHLLEQAICSISIAELSYEASCQKLFTTRSYHWGIHNQQCPLVWNSFGRRHSK